MRLPVVMVRTPTYATSLERRARQRGFTLVELLVAFAIAGLLMAIAPVAYDKARESAQYRGTLRELAAELRRTRLAALQEGRPLTFQVDLEHRRFAVAGGRYQSVPQGLDLRVTTGQELIDTNRTASIVFLPDGGASGGSIELLRPSGGGSRLRVDWLTGEISQEALLP